MYEDLEPIANLRFGAIVEQVTREKSGQLTAAISDLHRRGLGHPDSGPMISARVNLNLEACERICKALSEIWLDLIMKRNGRLSRADVDFIRAQVKNCAESQTRNAGANIGGATRGSLKDWATKHAEGRASSIVAGIGRELEIKLREQVAFASPDTSFRAFIRAFSNSWTTLMSGPLTVPFTILALLLSGYPRLIFAALALTAGIYSAYRLWKDARTR